MKIIITKKKMKNIVIKIDENGNVLVSAPLRATKKIIEEILERKKHWIEEQRKKQLEKLEKERIVYENGRRIVIFDKEYILKIEEDRKNYCEIQENYIIIHTKKIEIKLLEEILEKYIKEKLVEYLRLKSEYYSEITGLEFVNLKVRKMKTIWGSCNYIKKNLNFNYNLYKKNKNFIDYVVLHEICHLKFPNHQREFWEFLEYYMPDWKRVKKIYE